MHTGTYVINRKTHLNLYQRAVEQPEENPYAKGGTAVMTIQAKQAAPPANLFTKHKGIFIWYRNTHTISDHHKINFSSCFLIPIVATCWTRL